MFDIVRSRDIDFTLVLGRAPKDVATSMGGNVRTI